VTGLLTTSGSQFQDWSATYRLFSQDRLPMPDIFSVVRRAIADQLPAGARFRAVLDDSLLRRSGGRGKDEKQENVFQLSHSHGGDGSKLLRDTETEGKVRQSGG
jgi:hypothetical protein